MLVDGPTAIEAQQELMLKEGILTGISGGAAAAAARSREAPGKKGKLIVVVLPDTGERYLSTVAYADLRERAAAMTADWPRHATNP